MSNFQVVVVSKYSDAGSVAGILRHNSRTRTPENADPELKGENVVLEGGASIEQDMAKWRALVPEKRRKDAVTMTEIIYSASPESLDKLRSKGKEDAYFKDALAWIKKNYGQHGNIVRADLHKDEHSTHLHVLLVPLTADLKRGGQKLCHKEILGHPKQLAALHTNLHKEVSKKYGLDRAIEGSRANHKDIDRFFRDLEKDRKGLMKEILSNQAVRDEIQILKDRLVAREQAQDEAFQLRLKDLEERRLLVEQLLKAYTKKAAAWDALQTNPSFKAWQEQERAKKALEQPSKEKGRGLGR